MADRAKGWSPLDLLLGVLLVLAGLVILGHTAVATTLSLMFVGWLLFSVGVVAIAVSLFSIGKDGFWTALLGGGLLTVLGVVFLRHTSAAAVTVTLVAGALFLVVGIARLAAAFEYPEQRVPLLLGGGVSLILGLLVLFNLFTASYKLLGIFLGLEVLAEGVAIMIFGRDARRAARLGAQPDGHETEGNRPVSPA
jgi:uncharacterized membrane protein HdeD (DUF308 family)